MKKKLFVAITCLITAGNCAVGATGVTVSDNTDAATCKYDQILELGETSAGSLEMEAQAALRSSRYDRSVELARKSLAKNPDDIDTHLTYAEALEAKILHSTNKDPELIRTCLSEWLCVLRNGVGEEKDVADLGSGLWGFLYGDEAHYYLARFHLKTLAGTLPRPWETESMYLNRALKTKRNVHGKLIGSKYSH